MIVDSPGDRVDIELMALAINIVCVRKNAQLVCEGKGKATGELHETALLVLPQNIY